MILINISHNKRNISWWRKGIKTVGDQFHDLCIALCDLDLEHEIVLKHDRYRFKYFYRYISLNWNLIVENLNFKFCSIEIWIDTSCC